MRVDTVHHESRYGAGGIVLACITRTLEVIEDLFIEIAEVLPLGEVVKVHFVNFVYDLPHELAGLHVVVSVLEHASDHTAAVALLACDGEFLQLREKLSINKREQFLPRDSFGIGRPFSPAKL